MKNHGKNISQQLPKQKNAQSPRRPHLRNGLPHARGFPQQLVWHLTGGDAAGFLPMVFMFALYQKNNVYI